MVFSIKRAFSSGELVPAVIVASTWTAALTGEPPIAQPALATCSTSTLVRSGRLPRTQAISSVTSLQRSETCSDASAAPEAVIRTKGIGVPPNLPADGAVPANMGSSYNKEKRIYLKLWFIKNELL